MSILSEQEALRDALTTLYDNREAANIANLVVEHLTGMTRSERLLHKHASFTHLQQQHFNQYTTELLLCRPVQYVLAEAWFAGMKFYVNEAVLIPRPETEELVEWVIEIQKTNARKQNVLDIGTGSGCISIALKKKQPFFSVTGIDVSVDALQVATKNANDLGSAVRFLPIDFLDETLWDTLPEYDIIVSNPPYIKEAEKSAMSEHVVEHEPSIALFVPDDDALLFYRKIAVFAKTHLSKQGAIFLEINEMLGNEVIVLFQSHGYEAEPRKDLQGKDRMVKITRKP